MHSGSEKREQPLDIEVTEIYALFEREVGLRPEHERKDYQEALQVLALQALANPIFVGRDVVKSIEAIIAELDRTLSQQINLIMHQPEFRRLEATWRGLWYVCSQTESTADVKLKFFNIRKNELYHMKVSRLENPLYEQVYSQSFATFGGEPFGTIIVDFQFDASETDRLILLKLAWLGSDAHTAFITNAGPGMFGLGNFAELHAPRKLRIHLWEAESWEGFRTYEATRYLCIVLPHILMRDTYGKGKISVREFEFEEDTSRNSDMLWGNPAWAVGGSIARSFDQDKWFAALCGSEAPGVVRNLPIVKIPRNDGGTEVIGPTDTPISYARERELTQLGFAALLQRKGFSDAVLNAVHNPFRPEAISQTGVRFHQSSPDRDLRAILCVSRFAQYIPIIWNIAAAHLPDVEKGNEARPYESMELSLQLWLDGYVARADAAPTVDRPLRSAMVRVRQRDEHDSSAEVILEIRLGYLFIGDVGPIKIAVRLENTFDRPAACHVDAASFSTAEPRRGPDEHLNSQIAPQDSSSQHAISPFRLCAVELSMESEQVVSNLAQALSEHAWILQHVVLGPLRVRALVAADLPIDQLIDFAANDDSRLEIDITHCVASNKWNSQRLAFLAAYPSKSVRGLSADLDMTDHRYLLRILDPLAVLDPGQLIPTLQSRPIECHFDMVILKEPGHDD
jgi:type VI secretion system protein ImpC